MSQRCDLTGKGKQFGHNVPFSQKKTRKVWNPNLQKKTFILDGQKVTMKLSAHAIRTLKKKGILKVYVPTEVVTPKEVKAPKTTDATKETEPPEDTAPVAAMPAVDTA